MIYPNNQSYLSADDPLCLDTANFYHKEEELSAPPKLCDWEDIYAAHVAYSRQETDTVRSNFARATGAKGNYCFMLLENYDRVQMAQPDIMDVLKNTLVKFLNLFTGKEDSVKIRNMEKSMEGLIWTQ